MIKKLLVVVTVVVGIGFVMAPMVSSAANVSHAQMLVDDAGAQPQQSSPDSSVLDNSPDGSAIQGDGDDSNSLGDDDGSDADSDGSSYSPSPDDSNSSQDNGGY